MKVFPLGFFKVAPNKNDGMRVFSSKSSKLRSNRNYLNNLNNLKNLSGGLNLSRGLNMVGST